MLNYKNSSKSVFKSIKQIIENEKEEKEEKEIEI